MPALQGRDTLDEKRQAFPQFLLIFDDGHADPGACRLLFRHERRLTVLSVMQGTGPATYSNG